MERRTTGVVSSLENNEIFVFGSNESGRHGKGAAKNARSWGAKIGVGEGLSGQTYAIPTKDKNVKTLSLHKIEKYVQNFTEFAQQHTEFLFLVTEIGCGLAGYKADAIAPMFVRASELQNVILPQSFWNYIDHSYDSNLEQKKLKK